MRDARHAGRSPPPRLGNSDSLKREKTMKRFYLCLLTLLLAAGAAWAQGANVDPGWDAFVIRNATISGSPPNIVDRLDLGSGRHRDPDTSEGGQKAALGTNLINGATVAQVGALHIDRLDDVRRFRVAVRPLLQHLGHRWRRPLRRDCQRAVERRVGGRPLVFVRMGTSCRRRRSARSTKRPGPAPGTSWVHTYAARDDR
jgi:hypothetical protein